LARSFITSQAERPGGNTGNVSQVQSLRKLSRTCPERFRESLALQPAEFRIAD
jgi:hypothetical protein